MKQADLNRALALATGETVERIARLGFQEIVVPSVRRVPPLTSHLSRQLRLLVRRTRRKRIPAG